MSTVYDTRYQKDSAPVMRAALAVRSAERGRCVACDGELNAWASDLPGFGWHCWPCIDRMADPLRANPIYAVPAGWEADEMAEFAACRECDGEGTAEEFDHYGPYGSQSYLTECDACGGTGEYEDYEDDGVSRKQWYTRPCDRCEGAGTAVTA